MRFITITIFTVIGSLVPLVVTNPVPNRRKAGGGMPIPLTRNESPIPNSNKTMDLDAMTSHGLYVREKILDGLDNYERNTGKMHPLAVKRSESELGTRGAIPLTPIDTYFWTGEISIGTPPQTMKVLIDTGAADMWVLGTGCTGVARDHDYWNPKSSKSAKKYNPACWYKNLCGNTGQSTFQLRYTGGSIVNGNLYTDSVTVGGLTANRQTFGSATSYTAMHASVAAYGFPADGLLGLAYPSVSKFGVSPLLQSLVGKASSINPTFSLKLSPSGAELYVGGANSQLYKGDITYTRVAVPGLWQVSMDDIRVANGEKIFENIPVTIDSGATYIYGDWEGVAELYRQLGGEIMVHEGYGYYYLPCDGFPTLGLTFGGRTFEIPPEAWRLKPIVDGSRDCMGAVIAQTKSIPLRSWVVGLAFLEGVYSVFDYGKFQIGFADLA